MKPTNFFGVALIVVGVGASVFAGAPPPSKKPWLPPAWKVAKEQFDVIKTVNIATGVINTHHVNGKDEQDRTMSVSPFTDIFVDDKKATIADLKVGMHVDYTLDGDGVRLSRIANVPEQKPPPTPVATATPSFPSARPKATPYKPS